MAKREDGSERGRGAERKGGKKEPDGRDSLYLLLRLGGGGLEGFEAKGDNCRCGFFWTEKVKGRPPGGEGVQMGEERKEELLKNELSPLEIQFFPIAKAEATSMSTQRGWRRLATETAEAGGIKNGESSESWPLVDSRNETVRRGMRGEGAENVSFCLKATEAGNLQMK